MAFGSFFKRPFDWDLDTKPALGGRRANLPLGKALGGSSSMNPMIYIRGDRTDCDEWAGEGAEGWGYDAVLPYFRGAEDNERGEDDFTVSAARWPSPTVGPSTRSYTLDRRGRRGWVPP